MSDGKKLRVGLLGVRHYAAARRSHLNKSGLFDLAAAYNRSREPLEALEKNEGIPGVDSYEELLNFDGLEGVIICSGAKFHAEQVLPALEKGLHVFVEKPLCSTPEEMHAIIDAQKKTGLVVTLGHEDHHNRGGSQKIKSMIDGGELGTIAAIEKTTAHSGAFMIQPGDWRGDPTKNPGGMLFQCGVHSFHELMFYFGPIAEISAMMRYDVHTTQTADVTMCSLRFESGLLGNLNAYHVTPYRHTLSILGTKKNIYRDDRYGEEGSVLTTQEVGTGGQYEPRIPVEDVGPTDECGSVRSFYNAVRNGTDPSPSLGDGARAVACVFAAEESVKQGGKPVPIPKVD